MADHAAKRTDGNVTRSAYIEFESANPTKTEITIEAGKASAASEAAVADHGTERTDGNVTRSAYIEFKSAEPTQADNAYLEPG